MTGGVIVTALESTPQTAASHVAAREQRAARWPRSCGACVTSTRGFWRIDFDWKRRRLRTCARAGASLRHAMWRFRGPLSSGGRTRATRAPGGRLWCAGRDLALILCSADCTCRWTARRRQIRWKGHGVGCARPSSLPGGNASRSVNVILAAYPARVMGPQLA